MIIIHRCLDCGHDMRWHNDDQLGAIPCTGCRCNSRAGQTAPELAPTFAMSPKPVERIIKPGDPTGTEYIYANDFTCACDDCKALYAELTG